MLNMETSYNWSFEALEAIPFSYGHQNVVYNVHWRLYGSRQTESGSYVSDFFGVQALSPYVSGSPFIPFENLTSEIITGWVLDSMGDKYGNLTASLNQRIDDLINPPTLVLLPPWTTPTPSPTPSPTETYPQPSYPVPPEPTPTPSST